MSVEQQHGQADMRTLLRTPLNLRQVSSNQAGGQEAHGSSGQHQARRHCNC